MTIGGPRSSSAWFGNLAAAQREARCSFMIVAEHTSPAVSILYCSNALIRRN